MSGVIVNVNGRAIQSYVPNPTSSLYACVFSWHTTNSRMFGLASEICLLRLVEGIRIYK